MTIWDTEVLSNGLGPEEYREAVRELDMPYECGMPQLIAKAMAAYREAAEEEDKDDNHG